jgi:hypothetical protein
MSDAVSGENAGAATDTGIRAGTMRTPSGGTRARADSPGGPAAPPLAPALAKPCPLAAALVAALDPRMEEKLEA